MKHNFTLSELVIVTVVCVVMFAVMLPAVNAKEGALEVSCSGNLKQLYTIEQLYAADNNGYICPNTVNRKGHARHRIPYAKGNLDVFHCPDAKDAPYAKKIGKGNWPEVPVRQYYIDGTYFRNSSIGGWEPFKAWHGKARKFEGTKNPELYVMIFDGNFAQGTWEAVNFNQKSNRSRGAEYRHDGSANVLFQDGHIAQFKPEDFKGGRGIGAPDAKGKKYIFASR